MLSCKNRSWALAKSLGKVPVRMQLICDITSTWGVCTSLPLTILRSVEHVAESIRVFDLSSKRDTQSCKTNSRDGRELCFRCGEGWERLVQTQPWLLQQHHRLHHHGTPGTTNRTKKLSINQPNSRANNQSLPSSNNLTNKPTTSNTKQTTQSWCRINNYRELWKLHPHASTSILFLWCFRGTNMMNSAYDIWFKYISDLKAPKSPWNLMACVDCTHVGVRYNPRIIVGIPKYSRTRLARLMIAGSPQGFPSRQGTDIHQWFVHCMLQCLSTLFTTSSWW